MTTIKLKITNTEPYLDIPIKMKIVLHYEYIHEGALYEKHITLDKIDFHMMDYEKEYYLEYDVVFIYHIGTKIKKNGYDVFYSHNYKDDKKKNIKIINMNISRGDDNIILLINDSYARTRLKYCNIL